MSRPSRALLHPGIDFEDDLQHDAHTDRKALHAVDQASRCPVSSEYTCKQLRGRVCDFRVLAEYGSGGK